uniref:Protein kinase domain-containing protein n=1 Tax=Mola mola TaxID=94237 RepID=A0A3Q3W8V6_MOLML
MSPELDEDQLPFSKAADVYAFGTIWYELQVGDWPISDQPVEAKIWLLGSGEGIRKVPAEANLGKEVTEILSACWSAEADSRPSFSQLADMLCPTLDTSGRALSTYRSKSRSAHRRG